MSNIIAYILESPLNDEQRLQIQLPRYHGGMGITAAKTIIKAIRISKWNQVEKLVNKCINERNYMNKNETQQWEKNITTTIEEYKK